MPLHGTMVCALALCAHKESKTRSHCSSRAENRARLLVYKLILDSIVGDGRIGLHPHFL
jgi:hypothetical protein